jgi:hypothetical protein
MLSKQNMDIETRDFISPSEYCDSEYSETESETEFELSSSKDEANNEMVTIYLIQCFID